MSQRCTSAILRNIYKYELCYSRIRLINKVGHAYITTRSQFSKNANTSVYKTNVSTEQDFVSYETKDFVSRLKFKKLTEFQKKIILWIRGVYSNCNTGNEVKNDKNGHVSLVIGANNTGKTTTYLLGLLDSINNERYSKHSSGCKRDEYRIKLISYNNSRSRSVCHVKLLPKIRGIPKFDWNNLVVPLAIILVPSREIGLNIFELALKLQLRSKLIAGGKGYKKQSGIQDGIVRLLSKNERDNVDLIISTPELLLNVLNGGYEDLYIDVKYTKYLIMEESDLLCHGFYLDQLNEVYNIIDSFNLSKMYLSCTSDDNLKLHIRNLHNEVNEIINQQNQLINHEVQQIFSGITQSNPFERLLETLDEIDSMKKTVIFCNTVKCCKFVEHSLRERGYNIACLHGEMNYEERSDNLNLFKTKRNILVTTNVSSRMNLSQSVENVISFDFPRNITDHLHRTWTMNNSGTITTLFSKRNLQILKDIHKISTRDNLIGYKNVNSRLIKALQLQMKNKLAIKTTRKGKKLKLSRRNTKSPITKRIMKKFYLRERAVKKVEFLRKRGILKRGQGLPKMPDRQVEMYDSQEYIKMQRSPDGLLQILPKRRSRIIKENKYGYDKESVIINNEII